MSQSTRATISASLSSGRWNDSTKYRAYSSNASRVDATTSGSSTGRPSTWAWLAATTSRAFEDNRYDRRPRRVATAVPVFSGIARETRASDRYASTNARCTAVSSFGRERFDRLVRRRGHARSSFATWLVRTITASTEMAQVAHVVQASHPNARPATISA